MPIRAHNPRHRYDALLSKQRAPENEHERSLYVLMFGAEELNKALPLKHWDGNSLIEAEVEYAYLVVFQDGMLKSTFEAFLLSTTDDFRIADALNMAVEEVSVYRHLFFDTSQFRNDLEIIAFMRCMSDTDETKELYRLAYNQGFDALKWYLCRDKGSVEANEVLHTLMLDAYRRALSHRGLSINSKSSKEALKHATLALQCVRTIRSASVEEETDTHDAGLEFKFQPPAQNKTVKELEDEVLH